MALGLWYTSANYPYLWDMRLLHRARPAWTNAHFEVERQSGREPRVDSTQEIRQSRPWSSGLRRGIFHPVLQHGRQ